VTEELVAQMSTNKVLVAILETLGKVTVPTLTFLDASNSDKELVIDYNEEPPSFVFSLRDKVGDQDTN
jgi:hypothetical protein